jgi:hypothetical protein
LTEPIYEVGLVESALFECIAQDPSEISEAATLDMRNALTGDGYEKRRFSASGDKNQELQDREGLGGSRSTFYPDMTLSI